MAKEEEYEHFIHFSQRWGWILLIGISILFIGFGMFAMFTIPDPPRAWDFGVGPDTPGLSIYTTGEPYYSENQNPPRVIARLPEALLWNKNRSNSPTVGTIAPMPGGGFMKSGPEQTTGALPLSGGSR